MTVHPAREGSGVELGQEERNLISFVCAECKFHFMN